MNKKTLRIAGWALGLSMAVAGMGAAIGASQKAPIVTQAMGNSYTVGSSFLTSVNDGDLVAWGTSSTNLATGISSNWVALSGTKADWIIFEVETAANGFYLKEHETSNYVYSSATKKVAFDSDEKTLLTLNASHYVHNSTVGTYTYNSSGIRPYSSNTYTAAYLYPVESSINITSISAVTLSHTSVPANTGSTITATATYGPNNATEAFVWQSSDTNVATISASATYGVATIEVQGVGTCTFTAKATHDNSIQATSATFTVTAAVEKRVYDVTFAGTGSESDGTTALTTSTLAEKCLGDGSFLSFSSTSNVFNGGNNTLKFSSGSKNGTIAISKVGESTGDDIKMVVLEAKKYGSDDASLSVQVGSASSQTTGSLTSEYRYYSFSFANAENAAKTISLTATKRLYLRNIVLIRTGYAAEQGVYSFSGNLLNSTAEGCGELSAAKLLTAWGNLSSSFESTETAYSGSAALFRTSGVDENGNVVEKATARYDYIVGKYLKVLGNESFEDFANRDPAAISGLGLAPSGNGDIDSNFPLIITFVAIGTVAAAGVFLLSRRRRDEE